MLADTLLIPSFLPVGNVSRTSYGFADLIQTSEIGFHDNSLHSVGRRRVFMVSQGWTQVLRELAHPDREGFKPAGM